MAGTDDTYDPSTVEVDRARMQGLGVGQKDLERQRDPAGEPRSFEPGTEAEASEAGEARVQAGPPGAPDKDYDERDADTVSFTQPSGGAGG